MAWPSAPVWSFGDWPGTGGKPWPSGSSGRPRLGAVVYLRFEPSYSSYSLLRIDSATANPYAMKDVDRDSPEYVQTQIQLLTSPNVLSAAASEPKVAALESVRQSQDAEDYLRQVIKVKPRQGSSLIDVTAETPKQSEAAVIVNAVVDAYLAVDAEWSAAKTRRSISSLETYSEEIEAKVEAQKQELFKLTQGAESSAMILRNLGILGNSSEGSDAGF